MDGQFITFGFACTPLYFVWEKVIGMHDTKSICLRALARLPVVIPIWFLAIIFPFFGPINSAVGALLVSFTVYIIPSLAHMLTYRKASARQVYFLLFVFHVKFYTRKADKGVFCSMKKYKEWADSVLEGKVKGNTYFGGGGKVLQVYK